MAFLFGEVASLENTTHHLPGVEFIFLYLLKRLWENLALSGNPSPSLSLHLPGNVNLPSTAHQGVFPHLLGANMR